MFIKDGYLINFRKGVEGKKGARNLDLDKTRYIPLRNSKYRFPSQLLGVIKTGCAVSLDIERIEGYCINCNQKITNKSKNYYVYGQHRSIQFIDGEKLICCNCIGHFKACIHCEDYYNKENISDNLCSVCLDKGTRNYLNNYTFKVEDNIPIIGKTEDGIYFGVELEYESKDYASDTFIVHNLTKNFAHLKRDSSIERGFEIVSTPCTIEEHEKIWGAFFNNLPKTVQVYRTCGMHVHATRNRLTNLQIGKMLVFLHSPKNRKFVELIAERKSNTQNNYEIFKKHGDGKNGGIGLPQNIDRHTALNLNNYKTIEFRIFNSPKNEITLLKNIEFCKALIKFTGMGEHSITEAQDCKIFNHYVQTYHKEYRFLAKFLKEKYDKSL